MAALPAAVLSCIVLWGVQDSVAVASLAVSAAAVCVAGLAAACLATRRYTVLNVICCAPADKASWPSSPRSAVAGRDRKCSSDLGPGTTLNISNLAFSCPAVFCILTQKIRQKVRMGF